MKKHEYAIERRKAEFPAFVRVLRALPQDRLDYRPDPKARTAAELAWVMPAEEAALLGILERGSFDWKDEKPPAKVSDIVAAYERNAQAVTGRLEGAPWQAPALPVSDGQPWPSCWSWAFSACR